MQSMMARPPSPSEKVYHWRYQRRIRWLFWMYPLLGAMNLALGVLHHSRSMLVEGVIFFALAPLSWRRWRGVRLVVTPTGVTYHAGLASLTVPWVEMYFIGRSAQRWYRGWEGIFFEGQAAWHTPAWFPWPSRWRPQFIPLWSRFTGPCWDKEVFDDLFHYAPWLAERPDEGRLNG